MRARTFLTPAFLMLGLSLSAVPASAQLTAGPGSSNAANQSFQSQNQVRGLQQQQTMDSNQIRGQIRSNQLYNGASQRSGSGVIPRGRRH